MIVKFPASVPAMESTSQRASDSYSAGVASLFNRSSGYQRVANLVTDVAFTRPAGRDSIPVVLGQSRGEGLPHPSVLTRFRDALFVQFPTFSNCHDGTL